MEYGTLYSCLYMQTNTQPHTQIYTMYQVKQAWQVVPSFLFSVWPKHVNSRLIHPLQQHPTKSMSEVLSALWVKKTRHQALTHNLHKILTDFQTFFTDGLSSKFATNICWNIPPRQHVATLPCEIRMSEKWRQSEICISEWCHFSAFIFHKVV